MASQTVKEAKRYAGMKVAAVLAGLAIVGVAPVAEADFLIILRNGREIKVPSYEEQGDKIVYQRYHGEISIPKAQVDTIKDLDTVEKQPPAQEVARCADEANGMGSLRDFLPAAGSIATYKGTTVYREHSSEGFMDSLRRLLGKETTSTFEGTISHDWRSEKGGEYYIATYKEREKGLLRGSEALQLIERADNYEVTCHQLSLRSIREKASGPRRQSDSVSSYDPPQVRLLWPPTKRRSVKQTYRENFQPKEGTPRTTERSCTIIFKGEETIHTPAGDFRAWRVEEGCRMPRSYRTTWLAKGRGVVKWQADSWQPDSHTPSKSVSGELVDFKQLDPADIPSR